MKRHSKLLVLCLIIGLEPPSAHAEEVYHWTHMRPSSFPGNIESAVSQCMRSAADSLSDRLTEASCDEYQTKLQGGQCQVTMVADGTEYDLLNGLGRDRKRAQTHHVRKETGRDDRALRCTLSHDIVVDWFTGVPDQSCNNVGFTFTERRTRTRELVCREANPTILTSRPSLPVVVGQHVTNGHCWCGSTHIIGGVVIKNDQNPIINASGVICRLERKE